MIKLTTTDKACLVLCGGALVMFTISVNSGNTRAGVCWMIAAFGGAVMVYANHRFKKKKAKH